MSAQMAEILREAAGVLISGALLWLILAVFDRR